MLGFAVELPANHKHSLLTPADLHHCESALDLLSSNYPPHFLLLTINIHPQVIMSFRHTLLSARRAKQISRLCKYFVHTGAI